MLKILNCESLFVESSLKFCSQLTIPTHINLHIFLFLFQHKCVISTSLLASWFNYLNPWSLFYRFSFIPKVGRSNKSYGKTRSSIGFFAKFSTFFNFFDSSRGIFSPVIQKFVIITDKKEKKTIFGGKDPTAIFRLIKPEN